MGIVRIERELAGRPLVLETGRLAKQADGAVLVTYGETVVLACIQSAKPREGLDFFPLTVDYREKTYAAGKFPGGFFKREARPTDKETLTCRLIDRPLRPMFPDGYKEDIQVMMTVLSYDGANDPDIVAMIGAFAAVAISPIPFTATMGACRVGLVDDEYVINPTVQELAEGSELNLVIAATKDAITMVEAGATELDEDTVLEALEAGHDAIKEICGIITEFVKKAGKKKRSFTAPAPDEKLEAEIEKKFYKALAKAVSSKGDKHERKQAVNEVKDEIVEFYSDKFKKLEGAELAKAMKYVKNHAYGLTSRAEREAILKGKRTDGRGHGDIRDITSTVREIPRAHGSCVFTRGETQALVVATLGTKEDEQIVDGLGDEARRRFLLHYNFPPFSVGETKPIRGPGRREIGHGMLALRGLESVLPTAEEFPYTIRLVSEILESNGSSSMATVCGGTLAMMDAGVPIRQPVAGIAMGLVKEGRKVAILSDIQGSEDHCGDMDFKVTGTQNGITALQMDIKCKGLTRKILQDALEQAREGRVHILKEMLSSLRRPREELSDYAPRLVRIKIDPEKIGMIIGPGGKHIRSLQEETKTRINVDDTGVVLVSGLEAKGVEHAVRTIEAMTADVEVGRIYKGKVVSVKEFGAFVEILPGQEGLCHVSELSNDFIRQVTEVVNVGDEIEVKVLDVDPLGKIKLSRKATLEGGGDSGDSKPRARRPEGDEGDRPRARRPRREDRDESDARPRRPRRDAEVDEDDRPKRGRRPAVDDDVVEDERPKRGRRPAVDDDVVEDARPRRGRRPVVDDDADVPPRRASVDDEEEVRPRSGRGRGRGRRSEVEDDAPRAKRGRGPRDDDDRPRRSPKRDDDDRPRRPSRDDEDRPRRASRDDDDRPRRAPRDDDDRPRRSSRDDEDRPRRSKRDDEDRPRRAKRDDEDRPRRAPRDDDDRPRRSSRDDEDRPRRAKRDDEDRPRRSSRDDEDRPRRSSRDDEDRPRRAKRDDEDRPRRTKRDDEEPRPRTKSDDDESARPRRRRTRTRRD